MRKIAMNDERADKLARVKETLRRAREEGANVIVRRADGTVESVRHIKRLPDDTVQWTDEAGNPIPNPADADTA